VSYEIVVKKVEAILAQGHINLVETLAERIAVSLLEDARIRRVRVGVTKPDALPDGIKVGVVIERSRF